MNEQSYTLVDGDGKRFDIVDLTISPPFQRDGKLFQQFRASLDLSSVVALGHAKAPS